MGKLGVRQLRCGAYLADGLTGTSVDESEWQTWLTDPAMTVEPTEEGVLIHGTTSVDKRAFTGLVSRRLYPADAVLICEMKTPCDLGQEGTYGFVVHLCNRLVGDDVRTLEIPDNNSEITFGRMGERLGWFHWWFDQTGGTFHKWQPEEPSMPFRSEAKQFHTVAVEYDEPSRTTRAFVMTSVARQQVGRDRCFRKMCSAIELKIDAQRAGLDLALLLRNCRLFPHPARTPVTVYVGREAEPAPGAQVQVLVPGSDLPSAAAADDDGIAHLMFPADACYPVEGCFLVEWEGRTWESAPVEAAGVEGIYPGDYYALSFE